MADPTNGNERITVKEVVVGLDRKVDDLIVGLAEVRGALVAPLAQLTDHESRLRRLEERALTSLPVLAGHFAPAFSILSVLISLLIGLHTLHLI